jgi:allophanate hydrolase
MTDRLGPAATRVADAYRRIREIDRAEVWIHLAPEEAAAAAAHEIDAAINAGADLEFAGLVVAIKDNIDVIGMPTTAGCPAFSFFPDTSAPSVQHLVDRGAIVIGKTNLDQFATGLVGTRSPHGAVRNAIDARWISGGSSSGSAIAVALGIVDIALGTDTAGSGRVPAAFNEIIGLKPTRGLISGRGVVPACRSLDCVSVLARSVELADRALRAMAVYDPQDPWSRKFETGAPLARTVRIGVAKAESLGLSPSYELAYTRWVQRVATRPSVEVVEFDASSLLAAGNLLYDGAFVAERAAAVGEFVESNWDAVDPVVASIIRKAGMLSATDWAADVDRLASARRAAELALEHIDSVALPAVPTIFTIEQVALDPIATNAALGNLNNFCNLLDFCAATIPGDRTELGEPFGVNLFGRAGTDRFIAELASQLNDEAPLQAGGWDDPPVLLAVVGAHLRGQPLNTQLTDLDATFVCPPQRGNTGCSPSTLFHPNLA